MKIFHPPLIPPIKGEKVPRPLWERVWVRGIFVLILCSETNLTMDDKKAAIIKILEMAIIEEIKAKNFYFKMSAQLTNKEAQSRFKHMAEAEQEHEDILIVHMEDDFLFDVIEQQAEEGIGILDITEPEH